MAETDAAQPPGGVAAAPELTEKEFSQLVDLVYELLRNELLVERERRGEGQVFEWR